MRWKGFIWGIFEMLDLLYHNGYSNFCLLLDTLNIPTPEAKPRRKRKINPRSKINCLFKQESSLNKFHWEYNLICRKENRGKIDDRWTLWILCRLHYLKIQCDLSLLKKEVKSFPKQWCKNRREMYKWWENNRNF